MSTLPCGNRASCTDSTPRRSDGSRGPGIIRPAGPRAGPHRSGCLVTGCDTSAFSRPPGPRTGSGAAELRITRVLSGVGRGLEGRAGFMFAGCCWWRSLAVGGGSGTSGGHAPAMRGPGSRRRGAAARHPAPPREPLAAPGPLRVWLCTHAREVRLPEANTYPRNMSPGANGVRDLLSAAAPSWTFSISVVCVIQDHPAHTP